MRIAVFGLAILVFAAGLVLDTGALLALIVGFFREHALTATTTALVVVATVAGWRRLRRRKRTKTRDRPGQARQASGPRQPRVGNGRGRSRTGKSARTK